MVSWPGNIRLLSVSIRKVTWIFSPIGWIENLMVFLRFTSPLNIHGISHVTTFMLEDRRNGISEFVEGLVEQFCNSPSFRTLPSSLHLYRDFEFLKACVGISTFTANCSYTWLAQLFRQHLLSLHITKTFPCLLFSFLAWNLITFFLTSFVLVTKEKRR